MKPCPDCHTEDDEHPLWCPQAKRDAREREAQRAYRSTLPPLMGRLGPDLVVRPLGKGKREA